jgi:hypothetical protein
MRKFVLATFCMLASLSVLAADKTQTLTGTVTDAMCGAKHTMEGSAAQCTRACVKEGSAYALVVGDKVYKLTGKTDGLDALAGDQATVTGNVNGDSIEVASVTSPSAK